MRLISFSLLVMSCCIVVCACNKTPTVKAPSDAAATAEHDHASEGPHGGHIIELGIETHHAELAHDDASHRVGVYLLDGSARDAAPIKAESVTINVSQDGQPTQFVLPAVPQPGDGEGMASYFELISEPLCAVVCGESEAANTNARLSITIDEKPFVGIVETEPHGHEHGHDHDHGHDHGH